MRPFLTITALVLSTSAWADTIQVSGQFTYGLDIDHFRFSGPALSFYGANPGAPAQAYEFCQNAYIAPCTLGWNFGGYSGTALGAEYNGQVIDYCTTVCGYSSGMLPVGGVPYLFGPNSCPGGVGFLCYTTPIAVTVNGRATVYFSDGTLLYDALLNGTGTMTATFSDFGGGVIGIYQLDGNFSGTASIAPEPGTFVLLSAGLILAIARWGNETRRLFG
jgi:hypothetical protein